MRGSHLVLLLAIADRADDDGVAFPRFEELVMRTRSDDRTVKRLLQECEEAGELYRASGRGAGNRSSYFLTCGFDQARIAHILEHHPRLKMNALWASQASAGLYSAQHQRRVTLELTLSDRRATKLARKLRRLERKKKVSNLTPFKDDSSDTFLPGIKVSKMAEKGVNSDTKKVTELTEKGVISDMQNGLNSSSHNETGGLTVMNSHGTVMNSQADFAQNSPESSSPERPPFEAVDPREGVSMMRAAVKRSPERERLTLKDSDSGAWVEAEIEQAFRELAKQEFSRADRETLREMEGLGWSSQAISELMRRIHARSLRRAVEEGKRPEKIRKLAYFLSGAREIDERAQKAARAAATSAVGSRSDDLDRAVLKAIRREVDEWEPSPD